MSNDETGIQVVAADEAELLGGRHQWKRVNPETMRANMDTMVAQLRDMLATSGDDDVSGFGITQVKVALTIGAHGQIGILGTGAEASVGASITLTFERRH